MDEDDLRSYEELEKYLGKKQNRPCPHSGKHCRIERKFHGQSEYANSDVVVRYHETDVITFVWDGSIVLNSGGHRTLATKNKINQFLPKCLWIAPYYGVWFLYHGVHMENDWQERTVFYDGMVIRPDHTVDVPRDIDLRVEARLQRQIRRYSKEYARAFLGGGVMRPLDLELESLGGKEGIQQAMDKQVYPGAILAEAWGEFPQLVPPSVEETIHYWSKGHLEFAPALPYPDNTLYERLVKLVRRYLMRVFEFTS
jgi:hypothetical protein